MKQDSFQSPTHGQVDLNSLLSLIKMFLSLEPESEYSLVIGSDSHERPEKENGHKYVSVITAIVVHRKGFGGKYFWFRNKSVKVHTLREKIYAETFASLTFATNFVPLLKRSLNGKAPKYLLEIHVDVGEHGETREMIKEVVGIVSGNGFVAKTKPQAYGASYIADRHT